MKMEKQKKCYYICVWYFLVFPIGVSAQTLVSQMGPVQFFNSLDSAKSATLTKIAGRCFCMMQLIDSTHAMQLKLDLAGSSDSVFYLLDFNNLEGNYIAPDSTAVSMDSQYEIPGIYIKARDSVLRSDIILRLVDYGVRHFSELQQRKRSGLFYDKAFVAAQLKLKPSTGFKKAIARCK